MNFLEEKDNQNESIAKLVWRAMVVNTDNLQEETMIYAIKLGVFDKAFDVFHSSDHQLQMDAATVLGNIITCDNAEIV